MMRIIFASLVALALAACSSSPEKTQAIIAAAQSEPLESFAVGTLAPVGSFEWQAAPAYTKLALLRHSAAKKLRAGEITVSTALDVQAAADGIRSQLDAAIAADAAKQSTEAAKLLIAAGVQLFAAEAALENSQVSP